MLKMLKNLLQKLKHLLHRMFSSAYTAYVIMLIFVLLGQVVARNNEQHDIARNHDAIARIVVERDQARIISCLQYNETQKVQIAAEIKQSHDFVTALVNGSTDPTTVLRAKTFNTTHDKLIRSEHVARNCTPEGIKIYLKGSKATQAFLDEP